VHVERGCLGLLSKALDKASPPGKKSAPSALISSGKKAILKSAGISQQRAAEVWSRASGRSLHPKSALASVSNPRQDGVIMRQKNVKPWEKIGISRATWYRHEKPTEKPERDNLADVAKQFGYPSVRSMQRALRVMRSELWPIVERGLVSIAKADRSLADPDFMRRAREILSQKPPRSAISRSQQ
jgi:hypothetical protein